MPNQKQSFTQVGNSDIGNLSNRFYTSGEARQNGEHKVYFSKNWNRVMEKKFTLDLSGKHKYNVMAKKKKKEEEVNNYSVQ